MRGASVLAAGGSTWEAVVDYANHRITQLTAVCVARTSSFDDVRAAQAAIEELKMLLRLRDVARSVIEDAA